MDCWELAKLPGANTLKEAHDIGLLLAPQPQRGSKPGGPQGSSTGVLHRGPPQGSLGNPRKPRNFRYFSDFLRYFLDFGSNIKVVGQNNVFFELLQQK